MTPGYVRVDLQSLRVGTDLDFNLYISEGGELVLYRAASLPLDVGDASRLATGGARFLFAPDDHAARVARYFERHLADILTDDAVPTASKARTAVFGAEGLARDILDGPNDENLRRARRLVGSIASWAGITSLTRVADLTLGAFFHDIGMIEIPLEIPEKPGPLTPDDWEFVWRHPEIGERLISETRVFNDPVATAVRMHHERIDGGGYPDGALGAEIPWEVRRSLSRRGFRRVDLAAAIPPTDSLVSRHSAHAGRRIRRARPRRHPQSHPDALQRRARHELTPAAALGWRPPVCADLPRTTPAATSRPYSATVRGRTRA